MKFHFAGKDVWPKHCTTCLDTNNRGWVMAYLINRDAFERLQDNLRWNYERQSETTIPQLSDNAATVDRGTEKS